MTSRNTSLGHALGEGRALAAVLAERRSIAEGVSTAAAVATLAARIGVEMPIVEAVHRILTDQTHIDDEVRALLARPLKSEA
jgi:glycerol-3-phosphate dehydrogenase (NAD(P)+)